MFANPISFTLMFVFECMCVVFRWRLNSINETHSHAHKRASTTRVHSYALIMKTIIIGWREEKTPPGKNVAAAVCSARPQSAFAICRSIPSSSSLFSFLWHFQFTLWNVRTIIQCARYRIMFFGENTQYTTHNFAVVIIPETLGFYVARVSVCAWQEKHISLHSNNNNNNHGAFASRPWNMSIAQVNDGVKIIVNPAKILFGKLDEGEARRGSGKWEMRNKRRQVVCSVIGGCAAFKYVLSQFTDNAMKNIT